MLIDKTMQRTDVHERLLSAPLAVFDEDIEETRSDLGNKRRSIKMSSSYHRNRRRSSHRKRSLGTVVPIQASKLIEEYPNARQVRIRLVFIHIGEIDTLNEKYQADIYFEARWREKCMNLTTFDLTSDEQTQFHEGAIVKLMKFNPDLHWSPQLFIENAIGKIGDQDRWFTIKKANADLGQVSSPLLINVDICEHRRMKGIFWEKLELSHFPADVQDLTISITSCHPIENCLLVQDEKFFSFVNREAFSDQQEWSLYEHVAIEERRTTEEYSFDDDQSGMEEKNHSVLAVTCRAARRPGYYYWNGFCLIFLITICAFCIFSIPPNYPQNRLQITSTLVLTSVTFRWVVNRSLPQISYLTTLDIYAIFSIIILVVLCIWHSIIAAIIFYGQFMEIIGPGDSYVVIDRTVFLVLFGVYALTNISMFIWLIRVPYKRRREMERLDREYCAKKRARSFDNQSCFSSKQEPVFQRSSTVFDPVPNVKLGRAMRSSDGGIVIPNGTTFIPIEEVTGEMQGKAMDLVEQN